MRVHGSKPHTGTYETRAENGGAKLTFHAARSVVASLRLVWLQGQVSGSCGYRVNGLAGFSSHGN